METTDVLAFEDFPDHEDMPVEGPSRKLVTDKSDRPVSMFADRARRGRLMPQPEFQRKYVWDRPKASRLIESALLGLPLPIVYLSEEPDGRETVIDGQQRLTSLIAYLDGFFPGDATDERHRFRLKGLRVFAELEGKAFQDLDAAQQDRLESYSIPTVIFRRDSDAEVKFEVFERINTGSVKLNDQELRNCIYRGSYNDLLKELASGDEFRRLVGLRAEEPRMRDVELVLRFAAFHHSTYLRYRSPMRRFLNEDMEKHRHLSEMEAQAFRDAFRRAVQNVTTVLGPHAFKRFHRGDARNPNGRWEEQRFNAALYDVQMGTLAEVDRNLATRNADALRESLVALMTDNDEFNNAILLSTSSVQAVRKRFDLWRTTMDSVLGNDRPEVRCFTRAFKQRLYDADPTCSLCGNHIAVLDDAAVDHVEQYWLGGRTISENARLTHRYCNMARPRHDTA